MSCAGGSCRSGRRTSKSASRTSTPKPRGSRASRPSARPSSGPVASCRLMSFTSGRRPGRGSNPSEDFESARWPRSLGEPSRFKPTSAERQRSSSFTRISILIIAADSRTIHSEYVGKTTGPETMFAANRLVGQSATGSKRPNNSSGYILPNF
jgi:hypothetical protein